MQRRTFLKTGTAGLAAHASGLSGLLAWAPRASAATVRRTLYITDGYITQPDGVDVYFKAFSADATALDVPGAPIECQEGDTVEITVVNTLSSAHSFVVDGLVDSGAIAAGTMATVSFTATTAGSYLYYDGQNQPYNRAAGLHGGFVVMPVGSSTELYTGSPTFVQQYLWVVHDIDPTWNEAVRQGVTPSGRYEPLYFTLNGLSMRVPGHPDYANPSIDAGYNPNNKIRGSIGDRALIRILNAGQAMHSVHFHANHVEWLARNRQIRPDIWRKDTLFLPNNRGGVDVIYPFEPPPDAHPPVTTGKFPMHLHDEMTQTAGGGLYQFGCATTISFE